MHPHRFPAGASASSWFAKTGPEHAAFDLLVDKLIAQLRAGKAVDWSAVNRDHPEHGRRLRSMAVALEALGDLSGVSASAISRLALNTQEDLVPGTLGDFRILREVGRGGMGVVYEAEQLSLDRRVALKVLPFAATMDPRQLQRFRHEARAAAMLHHPHIVPVYGVGCERGIHYYAMQLIDGCSLAQVIADLQLRRFQTRIAESEIGNPKSIDSPKSQTQSQTEHRVSEKGVSSDSQSVNAITRSLAATRTVQNPQTQKSFRQVAELIAQAAEALEYAHTMGVVHRDVKPANLLLDAGGNVWVTDFGLARLSEGPGLTLSGDLVGTLRYMSPEQALAKHGLVDHRTDVYSLGVTLYELLTLRPAVDGVSKQEILHRLAFDEPLAPRRFDRSIPADLETVTLKAVAKNAQERYTTAQELADDLRRWLADLPIRARPPGTLLRIRKWTHRHRPLVAVMVSSLLLFAVGITLVAVLYGFSKGEMAEQKKQSERKIAAQLRHVLVSRAETIRLARPPGYRRRVWADLHQAIALPPDLGWMKEGDDQIRTTVLACMGDPVGLDPVEDPGAVQRVTRPELPLPKGGPICADPRAVASDGNRIAYAGRDANVRVYNQQGTLLRREESPLGGIYALALAADGTLLVAGCEQGFVVWDLTGPDRWVVCAGNITSVAISPNRRLLAIGGRKLELWSLATKRLLASYSAPSIGTGFEFSADGRVLLAVNNGTPIAGWPVSDTPERRVLDGHDKGVPAIIFSPDGRHLVSAGKDRMVRVWDTRAGRTLHTLTGHTADIEAVAINSDGSLMATGDFTGRIRLWDFKRGAFLLEAGRGGPPGQVWRLQFSAGGEYLAAAGSGGAVVWTVHRVGGHVNLELLWTYPVTADQLGVIDLAIRPGGTELVFLTRTGKMYSYDLAKAESPHRLATNAQSTLRSLHFTPNGERLTFVTMPGRLGFLDWHSKVAKETLCRAESVALSANGRWAAAAGPDRTVTIIEIESGHEVLVLPPEGADIWCLGWTSDQSKLAVGLSDGVVVLWDLGQVRDRLQEFGLDSPLTALPVGEPRLW